MDWGFNLKKATLWVFSHQWFKGNKALLANDHDEEGFKLNPLISNDEDLRMFMANLWMMFSGENFPTLGFWRNDCEFVECYYSAQQIGHRSERQDLEENEQ